jgi:hypothetical protein
MKCLIPTLRKAFFNKLLGAVYLLDKAGAPGDGLTQGRQLQPGCPARVATGATRIGVEAGERVGVHAAASSAPVKLLIGIVANMLASIGVFIHQKDAGCRINSPAPTKPDFMQADGPETPLRCAIES